ncbi:MAG: hypothetical protein SFU25_02695 [Candidatus Caenarcaniphilales bacterium]|nr:hypothetical protein [Candidatus Caenarcaniphilales bacterium]
MSDPRVISPSVSTQSLAQGTTDKQMLDLHAKAPSLQELTGNENATFGNQFKEQNFNQFNSGYNSLTGSLGSTPLTDAQAVEKLNASFGSKIQRGFQEGGQDTSKVKEFIQEAINIGKQFNYPNPAMFAGGLLKLMELECGFNPVKTNSLGYKGLIQFSPENQRKYNPVADPIQQMRGAVTNYLKDNRNSLNSSVRAADVQENGKRLLVSVFTGPGSSSLHNPDASKTADAYGTSVSKYASNIEQGQTLAVA